MATSSYSNLFGTTGAGQQGSKAGIGTMFGQQAKPQETEEERQRRQQPQQTFAQMQQAGMARPAPQAPQGQPFQRFGGSQQAQQARSAMMGQLQQQLAQPTRFDTQAFQQIRQAQSAQLGAEYQAQQSQLNEELARRGLSASSIGGGRMGDLAGQQARALAQLDAQLLQQAAQTQAQDRLAALQAGAQFAELAGSQDLSQFEANRVAQAAEFEQALRGAQFGQQQTEFERGQALQAAQLAQTGQESAMERGLREALGLGELGISERRQVAQEQQFGQSLAEQTAARLQQAGFSGRELDIRAQQIQQEGALQGRQLTIEEARLAAQQEQFATTQTLEQQRLAQQASDTVAERELRLKLQEGQLTAQEAQQLKDIEARKALQTEQIEAQQAQFRQEQAQRQAEARSQQTGLAFRVNEDGEVVADLDPTTGEQLTTLQGQQLKQQGADALAERELRLKLQTEQLTSQEKVALDEIVARKELQAQQLAQQAAEAGGLVQVGVEETKDSNGNVKRIPVFKTTVQAQQLAQQASEAKLERDLRSAMQTRELTSQEKRALDEINLRKQQLAQQAAEAAGKVQVGTRIIQQPDGSTIEEPIYGDTVQAQQLAQQQRMQEAELKGYFEGPNGTRIDTLATRQLDQARLNALAEQAARQSQLTGFMYKVNKLGQLEIEKGADGKPVTTEARRAQMQQEEQAKLDRELRERLGMGELTGVIGTGPGAQQTLAARNAQQQMLVQLAAALAQSTNISEEQMNTLMRQLYARLGISNPILNLGGNRVGGGGGEGGGGEGGGDGGSSEIIPS